MTQSVNPTHEPTPVSASATPTDLRDYVASMFGATQSTVAAAGYPDRAYLRLRTLPAISRLTRSSDFRALTGPGDHTIIPVLTDDTVSYVLDRLTEAHGAAMLTLVTAGGAIRVVALVDVTEQATGGAA